MPGGSNFGLIQRKCGKPNCWCAKGEGHPANYLSIKEKGKTRMIYISSVAKLKVVEETDRYRRLRQERATLAKLAQQSLALIDELQKALETKEPIGSGNRQQQGFRKKSDRGEG